MLNKQKTRWLGFTILIDVGFTILTLALARWFRSYFPKGYYLDETFSFATLDKPLNFSYLALIPVVITVWLIVFTALSIYDTNYILDHFERVQPIFIAITGSVFVFAGLAYFFFRDLSRFLFLYFYVLNVIFLIGWRKLAFHFLKDGPFRSLQPRHRILIVGQGKLAKDVSTAIQAFAWSGLEIVGFVNEKPNGETTVEVIKSKVAELNVDEVIFALPPGHQSFLQKIVFQLQPLSVNLRLVPDVIDLVFVRATIEDFAGLPLIGLRQPAISPFDRLIKRSFDIIATSMLLILAVPLVILIISLIKLSTKDAIIYSAQRTGEGGKIFNMYKFRTMVTGADHHETELMLQDRGSIGFAKNPDDPRITRIGRFLRRTSLDELPQFINVLKGDISLVGPRPELPWLVDHYEPWHHQRFAVPQGLTGWWQVKHRDKQQEYDIRVEDDLFYIHNYSFLLDLRILWLTLGAILRQEGAF